MEECPFDYSAEPSMNLVALRDALREAIMVVHEPAVTTMNETRCNTCGQKLPEWDDLPAAIEDALTLPNIPPGLRPMLLQTVNELRMLWQVAQEHGYKKRV